VTRRTSLLGFVVIGLAVAVALVVAVAPRASSQPDGLEKVAADHGIDAGERGHALGDGPFADYEVQGVEHDALGTAVAGIVGIAATFVLGAGAVWAFRRRRDPPPSAAASPGSARS